MIYKENGCAKSEKFAPPLDLKNTLAMLCVMFWCVCNNYILCLIMMIN